MSDVNLKLISFVTGHSNLESLQMLDRLIILISFAPLRKRVSQQILHSLIWLAYLLADWAAAFTIGLIQYKGCNDGEKVTKDTLFSFWAPFLVVHLGGPDTITALTMEDNELWRHHLLQFVAQSVATCNILYHNPPPDPLLWLPTALIFSGHVSSFHPQGSRSRAQLCQKYGLKVKDGFSTRIETVLEPEFKHDHCNSEVRQKSGLQGVQVVKKAYRLYQRFKGLIVDFEYSFRERHKSLHYFLSLEEDDAFRVVEIELNFLYDAFYTKASILHQRTAYCLRCCCLSFGLISFGFFFFWDKFRDRSKKSHIKPRDVNISYTLLGGVVALDFISVLVLIFSNWTVAYLVKDYKKTKRISFSDAITHKVLTFRSRYLSAFPEAPRVSQFIFRPWSNSICRFSLLEYYLNIRGSKTNKLLDILGLRMLFDDYKYVDTYALKQNMKKLIFQELKKKSENIDEPKMAKYLCRVRGDWVLNSYATDTSVYSKEVLELNNWIKEVDYGESLLLWHIATEICYSMDRFRYSADRVMSKVLSDYMVYLLVMKPMMMSNVAGISDLRLKDTEAEALRYIQGIKDKNEVSSPLPPLDLLCRSMMSIPVVDNVKPRDVKGRSKSVLFEACRLAKKLMTFSEQVNKWELMSRVWVELLCHAASQCRPTNHVQQVSKGGELISVVWLLMTHLGLGEKIYLEARPTKPVLIVDE
ncbi:uncharacterized protein LOC110693091 [Chenopodium quinoa]|uniref:uncharacterized protein LOC110693091 n=1 Tax=Chenopodium quinoa TaxID=63459 RepID=UPI000B7700DF|nr:uncharacterized protein LOC110693091 [Chenopodium quinoa]